MASIFKTIVSSGRCGSTWLAKLLNSHESVCIISDLIEPCGHNLFLSSDVLTGQQFDFLLNQPSHDERSFYWNSFSTKERLYAPSNKSSFSLLESYTLPFLFTDTHKHLSYVRQALRKRPPAECRLHLLWLFNYISKDLCGKQHWIERTGGSLPELGRLLKAFPDGKYVWLTRNVQATANSMCKYPFFQLYHKLRDGIYSEEMNYFKGTSVDDFTRMIQSDNDKSSQLFDAYKINFLEVFYEELIKNPSFELHRIFDFFNIESSGKQIDDCISLYPPSY